MPRLQLVRHAGRLDRLGGLKIDGTRFALRKGVMADRRDQNGVQETQMGALVDESLLQIAHLPTSLLPAPTALTVVKYAEPERPQAPPPPADAGHRARLSAYERALSSPNGVLKAAWGSESSENVADLKNVAASESVAKPSSARAVRAYSAPAVPPPAETRTLFRERGATLIPQLDVTAQPSASPERLRSQVALAEPTLEVAPQRYLKTEMLARKVTSAVDPNFERATQQRRELVLAYICVILAVVLSCAAATQIQLGG